MVDIEASLSHLITVPLRSRCHNLKVVLVSSILNNAQFRLCFPSLREKRVTLAWPAQRRLSSRKIPWNKNQNRALCLVLKQISFRYLRRYKAVSRHIKSTSTQSILTRIPDRLCPVACIVASNESKQDITTSMNGPEGGEDDLSCSDEEEGDP